MKLGIFGSRTLKDDRVRELIYDELAETGADTIVTTQEPLGVCTVAQVVAKESGLVLELHFLNFQKYAKGAFRLRSQEVIDASDKILLIHDGKSKGTSNELAQVQKSNKPYRYEVMPPTDETLQKTKDVKLDAFSAKTDGLHNAKKQGFDFDFNF